MTFTEWLKEPQQVYAFENPAKSIDKIATGVYLIKYKMKDGSIMEQVFDCTIPFGLNNNAF